ncbi:MAG: hypothetical protein U0Q03_20470 [Acidimicrobiales bacterium]
MPEPTALARIGSVRHRLARWNNVPVQSIIQRAVAGDDLASLVDEYQRRERLLRRDIESSMVASSLSGFWMDG